MPKRPRQSHIPSQVTRRRKPRRTFMGSVTAEADELEEGEETAESETASTRSTSAYTNGRPAAETAPQRRAGRRLELLRQSRDSTSVRVIPGQLPTYERAFLTDELRRIGITAGGLLTLIIVLAVLLR